MWMKRALWMVLGLLALPYLAVPLAVAGEVEVVDVGVDAQSGGYFTFCRYLIIFRLFITHFVLNALSIC